MIHRAGFPGRRWRRARPRRQLLARSGSRDRSRDDGEAQSRRLSRSRSREPESKSEPGSDTRHLRHLGVTPRDLPATPRDLESRGVWRARQTAARHARRGTAARWRRFGRAWARCGPRGSPGHERDVFSRDEVLQARTARWEEEERRDLSARRPARLPGPSCISLSLC